MPRLPSWHRFPGRYTIVFGALLLALFIIEQINGRFWLNDFRVYYGAGGALLSGGPLYGVAHGLDSGFFKYAPILALFYAPFSLLPYGLAASTQYALIAFAFVDGSIRIDRMIRERFLQGKAPNYWPLFVTALVCVVHLHRELHLGNINMLLVWVLIVGLEKLSTSRISSGGILIGIAIMAKPHFVVLLPLLIVCNRFKATGIVTATLGVGLLLPALLLGWHSNMEQIHAWGETMASHNSSLIYTGGEDLRAVNTIYSMLYRSVLVPITTASNVLAYVILGVIALIIGGYILVQQGINSSKKMVFIFGYLLLMGLVPSITLTDTEHFLLAMPLVAYLIHHLAPEPDPEWLIWIAIPILFAYGGNWEDALGPLSNWMATFGVLGIGNVLLIGLCAFLFWRSNRTPATKSY